MRAEYAKRLLIALLVIIGGVYGVFFQEKPAAPQKPPQSILDYARQQRGDEDTFSKPIAVKDGALSWAIFEGVKSHAQRIDLADGYTFEVTPVFSQDILNYHEKPVKILGYIFPVETDTADTVYLVGPYPPNCPLHYHAPPNMVVEALASKPFPLTSDPILITGTLRLIPADPDQIFYRLENATFIKKYTDYGSNGLKE